MAIENSAPRIRAIGFSGTAVRGGAGIKPAVLQDDAGRFYVDSGGPNATAHDPIELNDFVQRGLLCLTRRSYELVPGNVFLYADADYVRSDDGFLDMSEAVETLEQDTGVGCFLSYLPIVSAKHQLQRWGELLLDDAKDQVRGRDFKRALDSAERAGYSVLPAPPNDRRDHELNRDVFIYLGAAYLGLGLELQDVLDDASIDFSEREVDEIAQAARQRFRNSRFRGLATKRFPMNLVVAA